MIVHLLPILLLCTIHIKNTQCLIFSGTEFNLPSNEETSQPPSNCDPGQKACGDYCCPFADGVCCIGCRQCCRKGQVCLPYTGLCFNKTYEHGKLRLVTTKATDLIETCPRETTECGKGQCCMFPDATCCSDGEHCCPNGYSCDLKNSSCVKSTKSFLIRNSKDKKIAEKSLGNKHMKSCPGASHQCPTYSTSCCFMDNGSWGCCPKQSIYNNEIFEATNMIASTDPPCDSSICVLPECYCPTDGA